MASFPGFDFYHFVHHALPRPFENFGFADGKVGARNLPVYQGALLGFILGVEQSLSRFPVGFAQRFSLAGVAVEEIKYPVFAAIHAEARFNDFVHERYYPAIPLEAVTCSGPPGAKSDRNLEEQSF